MQRPLRAADIIDAVLEKDMPMIRAAFRFLISPPNSVGGVGNQVNAVLVNEVCLALAKDAGLMDTALCELLDLPLKSTFREGAAKLVALRLAVSAGASQLRQ